MRTDDGLRAGYSGYIWERRRRGGRAECQGAVHLGPAISDVRKGGGAGSFWIEGWGTMALRFTHVVVVAEGMAGDAICGEGVGTWIATAGPLKGERGTFVLLAPEPIVIVLG